MFGVAELSQEPTEGHGESIEYQEIEREFSRSLNSMWRLFYAVGATCYIDLIMQCKLICNEEPSIEEIIAEVELYQNSTRKIPRCVIMVEIKRRRSLL